MKMERLVFEEFEPRILYSADLAPLVLAGVAEHQLDAAASADSTATHEIAFVDLSLPDAQALIDDLNAQARAGRPIEVITIAAGEDGIARIGATLAERSDVSAVHLLSHGADGVVQLGSARLDASTLQTRAGELAGWGRALNPDADLLIYGCDVAARPDGRALIGDIAALTGADVAASDDLTGAARLGGNWVLEQQTGRIDAANAISVAEQQQWQATMTLLARDSFGTNGSLDGTNTGTGWANAWTGSSGKIQVSSGSLADPTGQLATSDGSARLNIAGTLTTTSATRDLATTVGADGSTTWISFLVQPDRVSLADYMGVEFGSGSATIGFAGYNGGSFIVGVAGAVGSTAVSGITPNSGQNYLLVVKLQHAAGNDTVTLYVNPQPGLGAPSSGASATATVNMDLGSFTRIAISGGNGLGTNRAKLDELRVGQTFADVAPSISANAPTITSDGGGASASVNVVENTTAVTTVTASDIDAGSALSYAITGGADAAKFAINGTTGALSFVAAPNFEAPTDSGLNNVYDVIVQVSDGALSDTQAIAVTVTNANEAPVITSNGGGATASIGVAENTTAVTTVTATDVDASTTLTYAITGGADAARFSIDASTGVLRFVLPPDFELPADVGGNNVYEVIVRASDGSLTDLQNIAVTVSNVSEAMRSTYEQRVNTTTAGTQTTALEDRGSTGAVAMSATGTSVVVWSSQSQDGSSWGIYGQRYDSNGVAVGAEFLINQTTADAQNWATVAMDVAGRFVVSWTSSNQDGTALSVYARTFAADGTASSNEFRANTTATGSQHNSSVSMDANGNFIVVWQGNGPGDADGIFGRRFTVTGTAIDATEFCMNADLARGHFDATVSMNASGAFAVVWDDTVGAHLRLYNSSGTALGNEVTVAASLTAGDASVALADDGSAVVVWRETMGDRNVYLRRYDATATALGTAVMVNTTTTLDQASPSIAMDAAGNFIVAWAGNGAGDSSGVFLRRYNSNGTALGAETLLNTTTSGTQSQVSVAMIGLNDFAAAWSGEGPGDTSGVFVRLAGSINTTPVITSNGGAASAAVSVAENTTAVTTVAATDPDGLTQTLTYSLVGGTDAAKFAINASTGALRFVAAPDFETPTDSGTNNVYDVIVQVSDGTATDTQAVAVTVTNIGGPLTVTTVADTVDGDTSSVEALLANAGADGAISLREALLAANASAGADQINFAIAGGGVHTINVTSFLPLITDTIVIDGRTQAGYAGAPLIEINGAAAGTGASANGLVLDAGSSNSVLRGLIVNGFAHSNINLINGTAGNLIAGNYVGTNAAGLAGAGTSLWGIDLYSAGSGNVIGGTVAADANVIGGSLGGAIAVNDSAATTVIGNFIGVGSDGNTAVGVGDGVVVIGTTTGTRIGGVNAGEGNVIAYGLSHGVIVSAGGSASVLGNRIFQNAGMAIDLGWNGTVEANDALDADSGPNGLQNFPVLTLADLAGTDLHLVGTLDSAASSFYRVEFYADTTADATGHGEGRTLLGFASVTTNTSGHGTFDLHLTTSISAGQFVSATATASNAAFTVFAGTSEFGANRTVTAGGNTAPTITSNGGAASASVSVAENTLAVTTVVATDADLPAQTLTYSIVGGADAARFNINSSTGALSFVAAPNFEAPSDAGTNNVYDVIVQVSDGTAIDAQSLSVTVVNVNEAPVAVADSYTTVQNTTLTVAVAGGLLANDTDPDGNALSVLSITQPAHGSVALTPGMVSAITNLTQNAAADTRGGWSPDGSRIVFDTNRNGNNEIYVMNADGSGAVRLTNSTADDSQGAWSPDGTKIAFMSNRSGNYEVWVMNSDGTGLVQLTNTGSATSGQPAWSPDGSKIAFTSDRSGGNFEIWVMNANGSGLARLTTASGDDSEPAWSPDGSKIVFASTRDGNGEIYVMNADGSGQTRLTSNTTLDRAPDWSPDGSQIAFISQRSGTAQVWVMAADGANPTAVTAEASGLAFALWSPSGNKLLFTLNNEIQTATIGNPGGFVYTPANGYTGADSFTYTVTDSNGLTRTGTVTLTVTAPANTAPVITSNGGGTTAAISLAENGNAVTTVTATDADLPAQALVYSINGGADAALFSINATTGALTFNAAPDFEAPGDAGANNVYELIVRVSDGTLTDTQAIAVTVTNLNDNAPLITSNGGGASAAITLAENQTAVTTVTASDADAATALTYTITGGADATKFSIDAVTGALRFIAAPDFEAPVDAGTNNVYDVLVQVSDGTLTDTQAIAVTVTNLNDNAPLITSNGGGATAAVSVAENQTMVTIVSASDADAAATLSYSITGGADAAKFSINAATGVLRFIAAPDFEAPGDAGTNNVYEVLVQVSDGTLTDTQAVAVTVGNVNEAPVITSLGGGATAAVSVAEGTLAVGTVTASDVDAATTLAYSITGGADAARFSIDAATGALRFLSAPNFDAPGDAGANNVYELIVRVSDGALDDTQALAVTVTNTNVAPVITSHGGGASAAITVAENQAAVGTVTASDADAGTTLIYSIAGGADAASFSIDAATGVLRFIAAPDYETPADAGANHVYDVIVQVSDGALTDSQAIAVTLVNVDEAPVIADNSLTIAEGGSAVPVIAASDVDTAPAQLIYTVSGLSGGHFELTSAAGAAINTFSQADVNAGRLRFVHDGGQGAPAYALTLNDATSSTAAQAASIAFTPVNDVPVAVPVDLGVIGEDGSRLITTAELLAGASDADGDALSVSGLALVSGQGSLLDHGDGTWTYTPDADWNGAVRLSYTLSDGTATVLNSAQLSVAAVNDAPTITSFGGAANATLTIDENRTAVTTVTARDIDGPAALRYSIGGGADAGAFRIDANSGVLSFVSASDREHPGDANGDNRYDVIVRVSDGNLQADQALAVTVANVDEAPTLVTNQIVLHDAASGGGNTVLLLATDPDTPTTALVYQATGELGGRFERVDTAGVPISTFTQADVDAGAVRFVQDGSGTTPTYTLQLSDGVSTSNAAAPTVRHDAPPVATNVDDGESSAVATLPAPATNVAAPTPAPVATAPAVVPAPSAAAPAGALPSTPAASDDNSRSDLATTGAEAPVRRAFNLAASEARGVVRSLGVTIDAVSLQLGLPMEIDAGNTVAPGAEASNESASLDLASALRERSLALALEPLRHDTERLQDAGTQLVVGGSAVSASLSVGYVLWLARGGVLMASVMSALPAWASLDPLPVLGQVKGKNAGKGGLGTAATDDEDDEDSHDAVEQLFSKAPAQGGVSSERANGEPA